MANEIQDLFLFLCLAFQGWDYNPSQPRFSTWVWESGSFVGHTLYQCTISQSQINFFFNDQDFPSNVLQVDSHFE